jgi:hypothetical protein
MLTRSLCMYPGYRRVVVLADMTVETWGLVSRVYLSMMADIPIDLFAGTKALERVVDLLQFEIERRCPEQLRNPHSGSIVAWRAGCCMDEPQHCRRSCLEILSMFE